jgi:putative tricarboxylic transport membrane protein
MSVRIPHTDKVASILLILLGVGVFIISQSFPSSVTKTPGPAFFPRVIAGGLAVLALVQFIYATVGDEIRGHTITLESARRVAVPVGFLVGYVLLLPILGFFLVTVVFLIIVMYYSGARDLRVSVPLAIILGIVLQNVFVGFLHVPLPAGTVPVGDWVSVATLPLWGSLS